MMNCRAFFLILRIPFAAPFCLLAASVFQLSYSLQLHAANLSPTVAIVQPATTFSESLLVIVKPDELPAGSSLTIRQPADGEVFGSPATVRIDLLAVDPEGDIRHVEFFANDQLIGRSDHWTKDAVIPGRPREHVFEWTISEMGRYEILARAKDTGGTPVTSKPVTILVGVPLPVVSIHATNSETREPAPNIRVRPGIFTLKRTGDTRTPLTVFLSYDGSATPGVDYDRLPETLTFSAGISEMELYVQPAEDSRAEGIESVVAALMEPPLDRLPDQLIDRGNSVAKVIIHDSSTTFGAWVEITAPVDGDAYKPGQSITIGATAADPQSYIAQLEFFDFDKPIGASRIDFIRAPDPGTPIHHMFEWQQPPPGEHLLTGRGVDSTGSAVVSKPVRITILSSGGLAVVEIVSEDPEGFEFPPFTEAINPARFKVSRDGDLSRELEVFFSLHGTAEPDKDYKSPGRSVWIPAGARDATIEILPISDQLDEPMETVAVRLEDPRPISSVPEPPTLYDLAPFLRQAGAAIFDRTPPEKGAVELALPSEGGVGQETEPIRFLAAAFHPSLDANRIEFYAGEKWIGFSEITFAKIQPGGLIMHYFVWTHPIPGEHVLTARARLADGTELVSSKVHLKVWDSTPSVVVLEIIPVDQIAAETGEAGAPDPAVFSIRRLSGPKDVTVTVFYDLDGSALNGVDYRKMSGEVLLPSGDASVEVRIEPILDRDVEGDESVAVLLRPPVCPAIYPPPPWCYQIGPSQGAKAVIRDYGASLSDAPIPSILEPQNGAAFAGSDIIGITVGTRDTAAPERLDLLIDGQVVESTKLPSLTFKWSGASAGSHTLAARALDGDGVESRSELVKILVYELDGAASGKTNPPENVGLADFKKIECRKDGNVLLQLAGPIESLNVIEVSSDLINWTRLAPIFLPDGEILFQDKGNHGEKQRFYRTRRP